MRPHPNNPPTPVGVAPTAPVSLCGSLARSVPFLPGGTAVSPRPFLPRRRRCAPPQAASTNIFSKTAFSILSPPHCRPNTCQLTAAVGIIHRDRGHVGSPQQNTTRTPPPRSLSGHRHRRCFREERVWSECIWAVRRCLAQPRSRSATKEMAWR